MIYDTLTAEERKHIEEDLILEAAAIIQGSPRGLLNWQVWHNAALLAAGLVTQNQELIDEVLSGERSVVVHLGDGLFADGMWWEQSIAYQEYTLEAFTWLALIAQNAGYDIFGLRVGDRTFRSMYEAMVYHSFADLYQPSVGDSPATFRLRSHWLFGAAYRYYQDPKFVWVLRRGNILSAGAFPGLLLTYWTRYAEDVPPSVASVDFAPGGRNDYGSSLFTATGMAVMRGSVRSDNDIAAAIIWKPEGTFAGHQHADNLSLFLTGHGHQWLAGSGRFPYSPGVTDDRHGTYARHTVAKNSLVVDGMSQVPQMLSNGLWNTDGVQTSRGRLFAYVPGPTLQLTQASSTEVYPGVELIRTVLVTDDYVLDVYDALSAEAHRYDWVIHVDGEPVTLDAGYDAVAVPLGERDGLQFIDIHHQRENITEPWLTRWSHEGVHLDHWLIPHGQASTVLVGTGLWTSAPGKRSVYVARAEGETARFVSVFAPTDGERTVTDVRWTTDDMTTLQVIHAGGVDWITLPRLGTTGELRAVRTVGEGKVTDLLIARGTEVGHDDVHIVSSVQTSLSAGIVDGVWVLHHEGPFAAELSLAGFNATAVTERDDNAGSLQELAASTDGALRFTADRRKTYIMADGRVAGSLDLSIEFGSVR